MNEPIKVPLITKELWEYMNKAFPEQSPQRSWTDRDVWIKCGERNVATHINFLYAKQFADKLPR